MPNQNQLGSLMFLEKTSSKNKLYNMNLTSKYQRIIKAGIKESIPNGPASPI